VPALLADHSEGDLDEDKAANSLPGYLLHSIARLELLSLRDVEEESGNALAVAPAIVGVVVAAVVVILVVIIGAFVGSIGVSVGALTRIVE
jgi:preprotein translocase subunit Sec61beta